MSIHHDRDTRRIIRAASCTCGFHILHLAFLVTVYDPATDAPVGHCSYNEEKGEASEDYEGQWQGVDLWHGGW